MGLGVGRKQFRELHGVHGSLMAARCCSPDICCDSTTPAVATSSLNVPIRSHRRALILYVRNSCSAGTPFVDPAWLLRFQARDAFNNVPAIRRRCVLVNRGLCEGVV